MSIIYIQTKSELKKDGSTLNSDGCFNINQLIKGIEY